MIVTKVEKHVEYICDCCGSKTSDEKVYASWVVLLHVRGVKSRTFEATNKGVSERTPNGFKTEKTYCGEACALQDMTADLRVLIRELASPVDRSRFTPFQQ